MIIIMSFNSSTLLKIQIQILLLLSILNSQLLSNENDLDLVFRLFQNMKNKKYISKREYNFRKNRFRQTILHFIQNEADLKDRLYVEEDKHGEKRLFIIPDKQMNVDFQDDEEPMKFELNKFSDLSDEEFKLMFLLDQKYFNHEYFPPHFDDSFNDGILGKKNIDQYISQMKDKGYKFDSIITSKLNKTLKSNSTQNIQKRTFFNSKSENNEVVKSDITPHLSTDEFHESKWSISESDNEQYTLNQETHKNLLNIPDRRLQTVDFPLDTRVLSIDGVEIPSQLNWRDLDVLTPIKDQIKCNACYAFAAIGAIEANHKIQTGHDINLSEQEIVDCSVENEGCTGGLPQLVYEYVYDNDISYTRNYPYDQSQRGVCRKNSTQYNGSNLKSYTNLGKGVLNLIKALSKGPVAVISYASFHFKHYGGGIYKGQGCYRKNEPNHASLLVGYNLIGPKKWLYFKNGWGTDWGENGFYKVQLTSLQSRNQGHCLVAGTTYNSIPLIK